MREIKRVIFLLLLTIWTVLPAGAQKAKGSITLSLQNEPMAVALRMVQQKSDYKVSFVVEDVKPYTVTVQVKNATAVNAVKQIIGNKPFACSVNGKFITVKKVAQTQPAPKSSGTPSRTSAIWKAASSTRTVSR